MPTSNAAIRAISLSSVHAKLSAGDAGKLGRHRPADDLQLDGRHGAQRRRDDRQIVRVERNADPADGQAFMCRRLGQIAIALEVDRARHDLDLPRAGLARAPRDVVVAGDDRVRDLHDRIDLVAEQRARPMHVVAVKPGIVVVDDVRHALQPRDIDPRRQPGQRFLLQPHHVVAQAAPQRIEAPHVGHEQAPRADRRTAIERTHIVVVEQRPHVEGEAPPLQRRAGIAGSARGCWRRAVRSV